MFKHIKNYGLLALIITNNTQASEVYMTLNNFNVYMTLNDIACQRQGQDGFGFVDDETRVDFHLQKGAYADGKLPVVFLYEWEGVRYKEILKGSCTAEPLHLFKSWLDSCLYFNEKLNDTLDTLNKDKLQISRKVVWNADKKLTLKNGKCWTPILSFYREGYATFFKWDFLVDKQYHRTKIQATYRFNNEELIGKIDLFDFQHSSKKSPVPIIFSCDLDYHLRAIHSIIWNTIPDYRKSWAIDNGIKDEKYETLKHFGPIGKILEGPENLPDSSFNMVFQKYLPSKYIHHSGWGPFSMTQVKEYLKEDSTQKIKVLHQTSYPILLNTEKAYYPNGFYFFDSTQKIRGIVKEAWRHETQDSMIKCNDSCIAIDLTRTLLRMNDTDILSFVECFKNFQPRGEAERIKTIRMRIADLTLDEKKKATAHLWKIRNSLLSNDPQVDVQLDCDELHFGETTLSSADLIYLKSQNIAKENISLSNKIEFSACPIM